MIDLYQNSVLNLIVITEVYFPQKLEPTCILGHAIHVSVVCELLILHHFLSHYLLPFSFRWDTKGKRKLEGEWTSTNSFHRKIDLFIYLFIFPYKRTYSLCEKSEEELIILTLSVFC